MLDRLNEFNGSKTPLQICDPSDLQDIFPEVAHRLAAYGLSFPPGYSQLLFVDWLCNAKPKLDPTEIAILAARALLLHFGLKDFILDHLGDADYSARSLPSWLYDYTAFAWVSSDFGSFDVRPPKLHFAPSIARRLRNVLSIKDAGCSSPLLNNQDRSNRIKVSRPSSSRAFDLTPILRAQTPSLL